MAIFSDVQQKSPTVNAERSQKTQNIDMRGRLCTAAYVNILAFFSVVASSQISPHFSLSGRKGTQKMRPSKKYLQGGGKILLKMPSDA